MLELSRTTLTKTLTWDGHEIRTRNENGRFMICLTDVAKLHLKAGEYAESYDAYSIINKWFLSKGVQEFVVYWEEEHNPEFINWKKFQFMDGEGETSKRAKNLALLESIKDWVKQTHGISICSVRGKNGGIYAAQYLFLEFIVRLSPKMRHGVNKFLEQEVLRLEDREKGKGIRPKLTSAIQTHIAENPKFSEAARKFAFSNEQNMLHKIVKGTYSYQWTGEGLILDNLSPSESNLYNLLQELDALLIKKGLGYHERKEELIQYARLYIQD